MKKNSAPPRILIAGCSPDYINYEKAIQKSGFVCLYPNTDTSAHNRYTFSALTELSYDLLLLPGGGDIPSSLYRTDIPPTLLSKCHSPDFSADLLQFLLLQSAVSEKKPILGICKGMQILNVFFGGDLYPDLPTADEHRCTGADQSHPVHFAWNFPDRIRIFKPGSDYSVQLYQILAEYPTVNSAHHQGIRHLGKDLVTVQYAHDNLPETIAHRSLPILGLQWHPERLPSFSDESFEKLIDLLLQSARV